MTTIILDLPSPPSVNRTRKVDWRAGKKFKGWTRAADALVLAAKTRSQNPLKLTRIPRFDLHITLSEKHTKIDLDNGIKWLIDYLRRIELIENDGPKHLRRLIVEWGEAPEGTRIMVLPTDGSLFSAKDQAWREMWSHPFDYSKVAQ